MFSLLKSAFQSKDVRSRMMFTLGIMIIFRIGAHLTVPGVNANAIKYLASSGFFGLLNAFGGGALSKFSIFALGVSPYITASIVVQLLQMDIVPVFVEWTKQGEVGRRKLNQATRYLTILIAFVQAIGLSVGFNALTQSALIHRPGPQLYLLIAILLTAGTMFLTWLGDMITVHGIGNGVSILIFSGIISRLPNEIISFVQTGLVGKSGNELYKSIGFAAGIILATILLVMCVVFLEKAERRLPIQYSRRATAVHETSHLPLKINSAGVIPVIFASSLMMFPQTILGFFVGKYGDAQWYDIATKIFDYHDPVGATIYTLLIIGFTFFYAFVQVNPEKVAENLQKQGGYIVSIRPGKETENYLSRLLTRLSAVGAVYLALIAILPIVSSLVLKLPQQMALGGTSLIIIVGVALEVARQIEGRLIKRKYIGFIADERPF